MSREHRGTGNVYQPTYKDKQTGDVRTAAVWWVRLPRVEASLAHLTEHFDGTQACDLTTDRIIA